MGGGIISVLSVTFKTSSNIMSLGKNCYKYHDNEVHSVFHKFILFHQIIKKWLNNILLPETIGENMLYEQIVMNKIIYS